MPLSAGDIEVDDEVIAVAVGVHHYRPGGAAFGRTPQDLLEWFSEGIESHDHRLLSPHALIRTQPDHL